MLFSNLPGRFIAGIFVWIVFNLLRFRFLRNRLLRFRPLRNLLVWRLYNNAVAHRRCINTRDDARDDATLAWTPTSAGTPSINTRDDARDDATTSCFRRMWQDRVVSLDRMQWGQYSIDMINQVSIGRSDDVFIF